MSIAFKHKTSGHFGWWMFNEESGWRWATGEKPSWVYPEFTVNDRIRSACMSIGPQSQRGIDTALMVEKEYELVEYND